MIGSSSSLPLCCWGFLVQSSNLKLCSSGDTLMRCIMHPSHPNPARRRLIVSPRVRFFVALGEDTMFDAARCGPLPASICSGQVDHHGHIHSAVTVWRYSHRCDALLIDSEGSATARFKASIVDA